MYQGSLQDLIDALGKLPGIGPKSAQRLAFYFLQTDPMSVENLARLLVEVKQKVKSCKTCGAVSETEISLASSTTQMLVWSRLVSLHKLQISVSDTAPQVLQLLTFCFTSTNNLAKFSTLIGSVCKK